MAGWNGSLGSVGGLSSAAASTESRSNSGASATANARATTDSSHTRAVVSLLSRTHFSSNLVLTNPVSVVTNNEHRSQN